MARKRHYLIASCGLTPQVVTETLYCLLRFEDIEVNHLRIITTNEGSRLSQDGMMGEINTTSLPKFIQPWLVVGQYTGIGKGTSMGMGRYELR